MDSAFDASTPLDYIEFQIVPTQNRYEAWVCYGTKKEMVSSGLLEYLLLHSTEIKALHSKGSNAKYKLSAPESSHEIKWFKRSTLISFLHIIGSQDILDATSSLKNEIFQLEETQKFHLSLYTKDSKYPLQRCQSDDSCPEGTGLVTNAECLDSSKNELLRAMDLRLTALRGELVTAFDQAFGSQYSLDQMTEVQKFSLLFGAKDLSDSLCKYIELRRGLSSSSKHFSESEKFEPQELNNQTNKSSALETSVQCSASPAEAAQVESQTSTESEDGSSFSSDQEPQTSVERSRALIRSASPRRSASPMRRVQIGRSGARRPTAIAIRSLNHFPSRERSFFPRDEDHSGEEEPEQAPKKSESSVRMSVQDAINLFESKQRDQRGDVQKAKSLLNANKSVLRRWSCGMREDSSQCLQGTSLEGTEAQNNFENNEARSSSLDSEADNLVKDHKEDVQLENGVCSPVPRQEEPRSDEVQTEVNEKSNDLAEWSRQKEAELNELFMKMMETKPVKSQADVVAGSKRHSLPSKQRGGIYDHNKVMRDKELREQTLKKKTEKGKQSRLTHRTLDSKKSKPTPTSASDEHKKNNMKKLQNSVKSSVCQPANSKTEKSPRPSIVKKDSSKASSSLPATRKSWPSIPSARAAGLSPAKTSTTTSTKPTPTPTRRRPQPPTPPSVSRSSSKVETSQAREKSVKSSDSKKGPKTDPEKKQQSSTKPRKISKSKVVETPPKDPAPSTKPSLYSKVTKKSSVVPLESKPLFRKGDKATTSATTNPVLPRKASHPKEQLREPEDLTPSAENVPSFHSSDPVTHEEKEVEGSNIKMVTEPGPTTPISLDKSDDEGFRKVSPITDFFCDRLVEPELKPEAEDELTISPRAWVEMEENEDHPITSIDHDIGRVMDSQADITPAEVLSPRVHHSLSQMLLEESSEPDFIDWGIAENPPAMVYQKDAPKGLKRLLKFARKSKNEANATGWSSPSVISEGEDDTDDSRLTSKKSAENLLRKATLQSMNCQQKSSTDYEHPAQVNIGKLNDHILGQNFPHGQVSSSVTTMKATRSFFSLSAFKGSK